MGEIFGTYIKQGLEYADKLKQLGEEELSRKLCVTCAQNAAMYNGEDMLRLFYGRRVYDGIKDISDAVTCVFIANCAARVYDVLYPKNSYVSAEIPWARQGSGCDARLREFFSWLAKRGRFPKIDDHAYFRQIISAYGGSAAPEYKVSDRLARYTAVEIIAKLVSGEVVPSSYGELR